jgi:hypothetical protein
MIENESKKSWVTEGLIIAAAPIVGYLFAFSFELGYAQYFKIPWELINIGLSQIMFFMLGAYVVCGILFFHIEMPSMLIPAKYSMLRSKLKQLTPLLMFVTGYFIIGGWSKALPLIIFIAVFILFPFFVLPILTERDKKGYSAKLEAAEEKDWKRMERDKTFSIYLINLFGHKNLLMIINLFIALSLVNMSGEIYASRQLTFSVLKDNPEKVILRIYGDNLISSLFDRQKKEVTPAFFVYKLTTDKAQNISQEIVGPLKLTK